MRERLGVGKELETVRSEKASVVVAAVDILLPSRKLGDSCFRNDIPLRETTIPLRNSRTLQFDI